MAIRSRKSLGAGGGRLSGAGTLGSVGGVAAALAQLGGVEPAVLRAAAAAVNAQSRMTSGSK